ncbi:MAG: DUF362 domain-containing protein [Candidatus Acidiferrum sp.]
MNSSRRNFFQLAGAAGFLMCSNASSRLASSLLDSSPTDASSATSPTTAPPIFPYAQRSKVALTQGDNRRKNVLDALVSIDSEINPGLQRKKYVLIKPNNVSTEKQLASTHVDALNGILDYLAPRFRGPVMIAESSAGDTLEGYANLGYKPLEKEWRSHQLSLLDLNREAKYETHTLIDYDLHITPVRLAARLFDPDAYVICCAVMKTHNAAVASLSVKNMTLGAPLHSAPGDGHWSDKRKYHVGVRQMQYNMLLTAQKLRPFWGATVIDGFEGMEGNGPTSGTPVYSRLAIASTDYIAADRVALEAMSIDSQWPGYLVYCAQMGLGQYDLTKIDLIGPSIASLQKKYRLHSDIDRELQWMGPMQDLPPKMGHLDTKHEFIYG